MQRVFLANPPRPSNSFGTVLLMAEMNYTNWPVQSIPRHECNRTPPAVIYLLLVVDSAVPSSTPNMSSVIVCACDIFHEPWSMPTPIATLSISHYFSRQTCHGKSLRKNELFVAQLFLFSAQTFTRNELFSEFIQPVAGEAWKKVGALGGWAEKKVMQWKQFNLSFTLLNLFACLCKGNHSAWLQFTMLESIKSLFSLRILWEFAWISEWSENSLKEIRKL